MPFPETPRVVYDKNPLREVVCQLRFPPILKVAAEVPAGFQERIRARFPLYAERSGIEAPPDAPPQVLAALTDPQVQAALRVRDFGSDDGHWQVSLSRDFMALTCTGYVRWEEFRDHLEYAWNACAAEFAPAFLTRPGLRYRNVVTRGALGLGEAPWSSLLSPHIAAELTDSAVSEALRATEKLVVVGLENGSLVALRHGLAPGVGADEQSYIIDCDFYSDARTEIDDVFPWLDAHHKLAGRLFRWCISERLHLALGPRPAE